jgi:LysR family transcriptional activator of nhaA
MDRLNYHHLRYFREVAHDGQLTRTAERLNLAQSALSSQIKELEARLGHPLFARAGRRLELTEIGRITLDYADRIFATGHELLATLQRDSTAVPPLRIGALSTLSRNFQLQFLRPVLAAKGARVELRSGDAATLYAQLTALALDVVLTTDPPPSSGPSDYAARKLAEQSVGLHGVPERLNHDRLDALLEAEPLIVPTGGALRLGFEAVLAERDIHPHIAAEVDDMAMVRLLTREGVGVAVAPEVVLQDEIVAGCVATAPFDLGLAEAFYAVTIRRSFPHPLLSGLLAGPQFG